MRSVPARSGGGGWIRRSRPRGLIAWLIAAALALGAAACRDAEAPALRVGTTLGYAPLTFAENGEARGVEIDFARRAASELGRELRLVELPLTRLIEALLEGEIDVIMTGLSITDRRAARVAFCAPYLQVGQMALIRAAEFSERSDPSQVDRPEVRIGVKRGSTGEEFARARVRYAQVRVFDAIDEGIAGLRDERVDYFVHDAPTIWRIVGGLASDEAQLTGLYRPLTDEHLAWAVRPDDERLRAELNALLAAWREEGFVTQTLDRWIPVRKLTVDPPAP